MKKISNFFKKVDIVDIFNNICDTYLLAIIMVNLYCIMQATSKFTVGKHSVAIVMALLIAYIIDRLRK